MIVHLLHIQELVWARNIAISNCGWKEINGKLYCLTCQKHNKEKDNYKPKKQRLNYGKD